MSDDLACWTCGTTAVPDTRFPNLGYVRCPACDLVFAPSSSQERLRELYGEAYFEDYGLEGTYDADADQRRREAQVRVRWLREAGPPIGRLLEIGCASGWFLGEARAVGYEVVGIEPAEEMAAAARERSGAEVYAAMLEDASLDPGSFDVAVAWHVLEHLARPRDTLAGVRTALRPGGWLLLELPNIASLRATRQGEDWYGMEPAHHVAHYSPRRARRAAARVGLRARGRRERASRDAARRARGVRAAGARVRGEGDADRASVDARTAPLEVRPAARRGARAVGMRPSFVVPSWDGLDVLRECLRALMLQTVDCEVVVVDNGSVDGTAEAVAAEFPDVLLARLEENVGFGRAVNLGAGRATGDVLLVVNNDAVPAPDFAERMVAPFADSGRGHGRRRPDPAAASRPGRLGRRGARRDRRVVGPRLERARHLPRDDDARRALRRRGGVPGERVARRWRLRCRALRLLGGRRPRAAAAARRLGVRLRPGGTRTAPPRRDARRRDAAAAPARRVRARLRPRAPRARRARRRRCGSRSSTGRCSRSTCSSRGSRTSSASDAGAAPRDVRRAWARRTRRC